MRKGILTILLLLAMAGAIDSGYLTWEHYQTVNILPCYYNPHLPAIFSDCGKVLNSKYSMIFGIPLATIGLIHYGLIALVILLAILTGKKFFRYWIMVETTGGVLASIYFVFLQLFVIHGFCQYCMLSAFISFVLFFLAYFWLKTERKALIIYITGLIYQNLVKPVFFQINPETIHVLMVQTGEYLGACLPCRWLIKQLLSINDPSLKQTVAGIEFTNPIGLAAGFDYEAWLTQILPVIGFGFETIGTITNHPYDGNPPPLLGRLPKSKSLMVNKGFKSPGADKIIKKLGTKKFEIPIGISIGRTNGIKNMTQKQSVDDIIAAFKKFERSKIKNAYYELNISCPNLYGNISFYPLNNLQELLTAAKTLRLKKPVFLKMPIEKSDKEILAMLNVISKFKFVTGVVFGNLQKNRKDPALDKQEVKNFPVGNFSGKPTEKRSNELIKLAYKKYGKRFIIIGCGGVFSVADAYRKIKLGATLVQLITGMIYQGPALIAQINLELIDLMKKDGYTQISQAIGRYTKI